MASVASASPSAYSIHRAESSTDDESWQYVDSSSGSVGVFPSPASASQNSWAVVGYPSQTGLSPPAPSPLQLESEPQYAYSQPSFADQSDVSWMVTSNVDSNSYITGYQNDDQQYVASQDFVFANGGFNGNLDIPPCYNNFLATDMANLVGLENLELPAQQPVGLNIPQQFQDNSNVPPWNPTNLKSDEPGHELGSDGIGIKMSPPRHSSPSSVSYPSSNPESPDVKGSSRIPRPFRKKPDRVEKRKAGPSSKFVIMTPNLINAQAGKPNPFECFDAMRATQRGRKGPLANQIKENALEVRRLGACFCCHSRKVKCDKERPCKNCKKLTSQVPQIMCWQFPDFLPVLFPDFIRAHFKRDQMARFIDENVFGFTIDSAQKPCQVELFSGMRFQSTLAVRAMFFTAKTAEVLHHWHMDVAPNQIDLQSRESVPIGIDLENHSQREELRKKAREYIQALTFEPQYAEQVTDSFRHTELPRKVLQIVQRFSQRSDSPIVKRALAIYVTHYVLTRQLCLTSPSILSLQNINPVPQNEPWLTPRVLARQIKSLLDEQLVKDMQSVFDAFSKSLKPKSRREWAPCLAAFLVLCLFMEAVETAADTFAVSQSEVSLRSSDDNGSNGGNNGGNNGRPGSSTDPRAFALGICREVENLPFRQFAYQFHQVYQTHSRDASTKAFNPLCRTEDSKNNGNDENDDSGFGMSADELDPAALEMVRELRKLLDGDGYYELDFLTPAPALPDQEARTFPQDVSFKYTGRLLARFLLSFLDEKYLFEGQY